MLISEFIDRTGFRPTENYYHTVIEPEYMKSYLDKDAWCKQWKRQGGIQKAYNALREQADEEYARVIDLEAKIKALGEERENLIIDRDSYKQTAETAMSDYNAEIARNNSLIEFLIIQAEKWSATDLREKAIELIGAKAYLRYKIEHNMILWEIDKQLLIENLK